MNANLHHKFFLEFLISWGKFLLLSWQISMIKIFENLG
jgi:hypothetical protein